MIQFTSINPNPTGGWVFTWPSQGAAYYRVVLYGVVLVRTQTALTYLHNGPDYKIHPPPIEIAYEDQKVLSEIYQPFLEAQWYRNSSADYYNVQRLIAGVWSTVQRQQETGSWVYTYQTPTLLDQTEAKVRVLAVDRVGNQSLPRVYTRFVVCPPTPPDDKILVSYGSSSILITAV